MPLTAEQEEDMKRRQRAVDEETAALLAAGHTCIRELESYPSQIAWCHKTPCTRDPFG